jgi:hypothetical protein
MPRWRKPQRTRCSSWTASSSCGPSSSRTGTTASSSRSPFAVALERALRRDLALFGSAEAVRARYQQRYIPGQQMYFAAARPQQRADAIVSNEDPANPELLLPDGG